jgi:LCP family protein required for cell wall assembly
VTEPESEREADGPDGDDAAAETSANAADGSADGPSGPENGPDTDSAADEAWLEETPEEAEERRRLRHERHEEHKRKVRRRRRRKRILIGVAVGLATLLVLGVVWFWWTFGGLERMPESVGQTGAHAPGTTILLIGSDPAKATTAQDSKSGWRHDLDRGDLVMLLHLTQTHRALFVISIPADAIVDVPGVGPGKLSDAASAGGPRLVARTVEEMTGVRLDRMAVIDLNAFREITDDLDGVIVDVPRASCGLPPGPRRFDGQAAMDYIALQPCMERKDLDRVERQQSLVKALMAGALDSGKITNPFAVNKMMKATASHLALEDDFSWPSMFSTLWSMRRVRTGNTTFVTVPVAKKPFASQGGTDYVLLDEQRDKELWTALRTDQVGQYLALNSDAAVLGR